MKATEAKLMSFLQKSPQFIIPIYQRTYSWTDKQCRQLWDDILRAAYQFIAFDYTNDTFCIPIVAVKLTSEPHFADRISLK